MKILITGGTGFLGGYLIRELMDISDTIYVVSRKGHISKYAEEPKIKSIKGDVTHMEVITMEGSARAEFLDSIDVVIHAAALYDLSASYADCFLQNVVGTQNILHLLKSMKNLKAFHYVSTIAVGDPNVFFLDENQLPKRSSFGDFYSETKFLAEQIVRENVEDRYVTRIIRPGIIIGDSVTREMEKIDGPYYFLEAFKKHSYLLKYTPVIPLSFNPRSKLPIIPVDHCAHLMKLLIERDNYQTAMKTYHLVGSEIPTLMEFLRDLNKEFGVKTHYIPVKENSIHSSLLKLLGIPKEVLPFMFSKISYDKTSTLEDLPEIKDSTYSTFKKILFAKS